MSKKILAILLVLCMFMSILPTAAFAEEVDAAEYEYGSAASEVTSAEMAYRSWATGDSRWRDMSLGSSDRTVYTSGSVVVAVAKIIMQAGLNKEPDFNVATFVTWLNDHYGFTSEGYLSWANAAGYSTQLTYKGPLVSGTAMDSSEYIDDILNWLKQGYHLVIASSGNHWFAVDEGRSLATGKVYIMDSRTIASEYNTGMLLTENYPTISAIHAYTGGTTHTHNFTENIISSTCESRGYRVLECEDCGESYLKDILTPLGHNMVTTTVAPTCSAQGYTLHSCTRCDFSEKTDFTAAGHIYVRTKVDATCTTEGYITYTCSVCGDSYTETIEVIGHKYEATETAPTCTDNGYTTYTCSVCGDSYTETIEAIGHSYEATVTAPTCTEKGYTTHTCSVCGDSYTDSETVALGHQYTDVVTEPTCTENGYTTHTCSVCGDSYTDSEIVALGHQYTDMAIEPTCTERGYTAHTCTICGDVRKDNYYSALGHNYMRSKNDDGGYTVVCSRCNYSTAWSIVASGTCGDNLTWTLDNAGTLTISGSGAMANYSFDGAPWFTYRASVKTVVLPDGITSIGDGAFGLCTGMTSVAIPDSVTSIGNDVFYECRSLKDVAIPDSVTSIGDGAFYWCSSLTGITIPDSVTSIGGSAFSCCFSLNSIKIPDSVTSIGEYTFNACSSLTSVVIPEGVKSIGVFAFCDCNSLPGITIPKSVTSIVNGAFLDCSSLTTITFSGNAPAIGNGVFGNVTATACYPAGNATWTDAVKQSYGGDITWVAVEMPDPIPVNPFTDVPAKEYYYTPVLWGAENGIVYGTSTTTFDPKGTCTRAQVVTFLYRLAGMPAVSGENPFKDVSSKAYYYDAVLWGYQNGIVYGTGSDAFSPNDKVTREQFVTFLYRYAGRPAVSGSNVFTDVKQGTYYYDAVLWGYQNQIVYGTSSKNFSPKDTCSRAQVVTFIYRYAVNYKQGDWKHK